MTSDKPWMMKALVSRDHKFRVQEIPRPALREGELRWVKHYGQSAKGLRVDWTDRGKLAMDALGYVIEDLGSESLNQQLWWAVGTLAAVHMMS